MNKMEKIYGLLFEKFGEQGWWPTITNNKKFEIILGTILTQNTSWQNVEKTIKTLNLVWLISPIELKKIPEKHLAELIRSSGYYNQKAKKIKAVVEFLDSGKELTRENLLNVWGIGPETADSILLYAYEQPIFVIDTYTKRILSRIGFKEKNYEELQKLFHKSLKKDHKLFNEYHALLVKLAKENCKTKPLCNSCPLTNICTKNMKPPHHESQ